MPRAAIDLPLIIEQIRRDIHFRISFDGGFINAVDVQARRRRISESENPLFDAVRMIRYLDRMRVIADRDTVRMRVNRNAVRMGRKRNGMRMRRQRYRMRMRRYGYAVRMPGQGDIVRVILDRV